ncbi:MAG: RNA 3'-terminal phosphate cyclase [Candidatus Heimdallarchaeota archaeon LC_2]|nr:MAG: RNA 3'-terminal phosphate cyclase [Candidatus Heimdallarchaeota archaeon LC_2]
MQPINNDNQIVIDGSIGGGSVLRVGVPLAIALNKPIHVYNIRQHRQKKGLRTQHLTGLQLLCQLTGSVLEGGSIGSSQIKVYPHQIFVPDKQHPMIQLPTSAAVSLIIQTISNYVFVSGKPIGFDFVGGGSHVNWSPNFDILMGVNKPLFEMFGLKMHIQLMKPGFYPEGGSMGRIYLEPTAKSKVILESGKVTEIEVISNASNHFRNDKVAERQIAGFKSIIPEVTKELVGYADSVSMGSACSAIIRYETGTIKGVARIGQEGLKPEDIGRRTAKAANVEIANKGSLDEQLADQLLLPLAFLPSGSQYSFERMFPHIDANFKVVQHILGNVLKIWKENEVFYVEKI